MEGEIRIHVHGYWPYFTFDGPHNNSGVPATRHDKPPITGYTNAYNVCTVFLKYKKKRLLFRPKQNIVLFPASKAKILGYVQVGRGKNFFFVWLWIVIVVIHYIGLFWLETKKSSLKVG